MYRTAHKTRHILGSSNPTRSARGDPQLPLMNSSMMHRGAVYQRGFEHCVTLSTPIKTQRGDRHVCFTHPNNKHINASKRH